MVRWFHKYVFLTSFILTVIIFSIGILLSYGLDFLRVGEVVDTIQEHELGTEAFILEQSFIDSFGGEKCEMMQARVYDAKNGLYEVGKSLTAYGKKSIFKKKDFEYLRRKYFILQLKLYNLVSQVNSQCGNVYLPVLFFYKAGDDLSERQGYILDELGRGYNQQLVVLSFDKDYEKEPLLKLLLVKYNISKAPTMVLGDDMKIEGLTYTGTLNSTIIKMLRMPDTYAIEKDFGYVLDFNGVDKKDYSDKLLGRVEKNISNFAKGDILLIAGRLKNNDSLICSALAYYDKVNSSDLEERALIYETYAALGCGRNEKAFLLEAAKIWEELGVGFRAEIEAALANREKVKINFSKIKVKGGKLNVPKEPKSLVIGKSYFNLKEGDLIVSQADRVTRDWLSYQINNSPFSDDLLSVFSESLTYSEEELKPDIGWHEGGRIKEMKNAGVENRAASGTMVVEINGTWYAPDEKGVFKFEVPIDKVLYPTTRFLRHDIAVIIDTHGINMLVEQAIRYNATAVIGCCDHAGKIKAAQYLSDKGIKAICFTDKYLPLAIGSKSNILGSPPIKVKDGEVVLGKQVVKINKGEKVIAEDVEDITNVQSYYDTPARYFRTVEERLGGEFDLDLIYVNIDGMNQTNKLVEAAELYNSDVIGLRVFNSDDYNNVKGWLENDDNHRAILFHSVSYPYGYKLLKEFPEQTSFDDINPVFE